MDKLNKIIILFVVMFTFIIKVDASFKEDSSTYTEDVYIFGSTKFDNNTIITLSTAGIAGMNEAKIELLLNEEVNTNNVKTYYYSDLTKSWNIIDLVTGKLTPLTIEEGNVLEENLNTYYVNNVEKTIQVNYDSNVDDDSLKVNSPYVYSKAKKLDNKIIVPISWIEGFSFTSNGTLIKVKLGEKVISKEGNYFKQYDEPIIKVNPIVKLESNQEVNILENTTLKVDIISNSYNNINAKARVSVINSNNENIIDYTETKVILDNEEDLIFNFDKPAIYTIKYELIIDENNIVTCTKTIKVNVKGNLDLYSIDDGYTLTDNVYTLTKDLEYEVGYSESGYLVYFFLSAPYNYVPENPKVKIDGEVLNKEWYSFYDEPYGIYSHLTFSDEIKSHIIEIEWVQWVKQTFIVKLGDEAGFIPKPYGVILSDYGITDENTLIINRDVTYQTDGYFVPVTLKINRESIYANIYINDKELVFPGYSSISNTLENWRKYTFNVKFNNLNESVKIDAKWGEGYTETFYVKFNENIINSN